MDLGMPANGNAALAIRKYMRAISNPPLPVLRGTKTLTHSRTAQCEYCRNYDCPVCGVPDPECGSKMDCEP